jgi:hypothetical protein
MASALLFNPLLHHQPRLEAHGTSLGHHDRFAGLGISGLAGFPPPHLEDSEVAEFDPTFLNQRAHDGTENILDNLLGLELCQAKSLGNRSGNL